MQLNILLLAGLLNTGSHIPACTSIDVSYIAEAHRHVACPVFVHRPVRPAAASDTLRDPTGLPDTLPNNVMIPDTVQTGTAPADTLRPVTPDDEPEPVVIVRYDPPEFSDLPAFNTALEDSTLRWMQLLNIAEWYSQRRGVIPNRLGGLGRPDAVFIHGHAPANQRVYFEGIPAGDPATGLVNFNRLHLHDFGRVYEQTGFSHAETHYRLRRYYLIRPITRINYEQGPDGLISTQGLVSLNLDHQTNLEMNLWNMSDDGRYSRSDYSGLQAAVAVHHQYNSRYTYRAGLYYNSLQLEEPGGYQAVSMETFPFDRFLVSPLLTDARSSMRQTLLRTDFYYRPAEDKPVELEGGVYHQRFRRFFFSNSDTTFYKTLQAGSYINWIKQAGLLNVETGVRITQNWLDADRRRSLGIGYWTDMSARFNGDADLGQWFRLTGTGRLEFRSDGFLTGTGGGGIRLGPIAGIRLNLFVSAGTYAPTIQQLYWRDSPFAGNPDLEPFLIQRVDLMLSWTHRNQFTAGVRSYVSRFSGDILMNTDSTFNSVSEYYSYGGEVFAALNTTNWEMELSSTALLYETDAVNPQNILLDGSGTRFRNRALIYRKGYLFDYATYVKVGLQGMISPADYRSADYIPALDWWDIAPETAPVPAHYRVDLDFSARIRNVFLLMKYENLFDQLGQAGYFESPFYPMPGRRFRLGIRWVLRN